MPVKRYLCSLRCENGCERTIEYGPPMKTVGAKIGVAARCRKCGIVNGSYRIEKVVRVLGLDDPWPWNPYKEKKVYQVMRDDLGMFLWAAGLESLQKPHRVLVFAAEVQRERLTPTRLTASGGFGPIRKRNG